MNQRQSEQQQFDQSGENLILGSASDCPLSPEQLAATTAESSYVVESFDSGLTAEVFRIRVEGQDFTLKKKRPQARVQNLDGQYSFLNEVQRRRDFQQQKDNSATSAQFDSIVTTVYANYRLGIILSEWVEGQPVTEITPAILSQLFSTLLASERIGLFEWDLCAGNLLVDSRGKLKLFDFGYMYPFDPLQSLNSNGMDAPLFHFCERFETRFLSGWLLAHNLSEQESLALFAEVKRQAAAALEMQIAWLKQNKASLDVIYAKELLLNQYQTALQSHTALEHLYVLETFRSHVLDIEDDLEGKSCTPTTIKRVDMVLTMLASHYSMLNEQGGLFYHNRGKTLAELKKVYQTKREQVLRYQL
ncbi:hypothetical protein VISI1226_08804 [Vibrio sinaloensis DSM 21326]|uniref:Phosphotransferase n=1 Tax=Vibrio sinaloensis DSM 21326 TaxID=945550 RepID=E8MC61_PHOS4|nr:AarF/UbiB family protein [Vibrio sinaloensis]EGA68366.1 hypothetical protein VISI1226_08804 [Vibrio sinaloensis DSM 21326]